MRFISLFSGIGGFDLGFERAGMQCILQVENDKYCLGLLSRKWPDVPKIEDVCYVARENTPTVGLICGGFPCQDVSIAGRREGLAGERSGLWFEFHRIIDEIRPEWVIIENVPGLLSSNSGRDMGAVIGGLAKCGYWWAYRVLDAQFFGVPQRRRRVFIVGCLTKGRAQEVLFERESSPWDTAPGRETGEELARDIAASIGTNNAHGKNRETGLVAFAPQSAGNTGLNINEDLSGTLQENQRIAIAATLNSGGNNGGFRTEPGEHLVSVNIYGGHKRKDRPNGGFYIREDPTTKTLDQSGLNPNVQQGGVLVQGVRRLTPIECERLQGFPDGWTAGQSDSARYCQLGNAVAVPVAEWLGRRIMLLKNKPL